MDGWPEWWLDLHSPSCVSNVQSIMAGRIKLAKEKGCDAVDPDNVDSYHNEPGWDTTGETTHRASTDHQRRINWITSFSFPRLRTTRSSESLSRTQQT